MATRPFGPRGARWLGTTSSMRRFGPRGARWLSTASSKLTLWHNPGCSKSRAALALLEERGDSFTTREYLTDPPTLPELKNLQIKLDLPAIAWVRVGDDAWNEHFDHATIYDDILPDDSDILRAIAAKPVMLERPILEVGARAVVGRQADGSFCADSFASLLDGETAEAAAEPPPPNEADADATAAPLMTSGGGKALRWQSASEHSRISGGSMGYSKAGGETWDRVFGGASKSATAAPEPPPKPRRPMKAAKGTNATAWGGSDEFAEGWDRIFGKNK